MMSTMIQSAQHSSSLRMMRMVAAQSDRPERDGKNINKAGTRRNGDDATSALRLIFFVSRTKPEPPPPDPRNKEVYLLEEIRVKRDLPKEHTEKECTDEPDRPIPDIVARDEPHAEDVEYRPDEFDGAHRVTPDGK